MDWNSSLHVVCTKKCRQWHLFRHYITNWRWKDKASRSVFVVTTLSLQGSSQFCVDFLSTRYLSQEDTFSWHSHTLQVENEPKQSQRSSSKMLLSFEMGLRTPGWPGAHNAPALSSWSWCSTRWSPGNFFFFTCLMYMFLKTCKPSYNSGFNGTVYPEVTMAFIIPPSRDVINDFHPGSLSQIKFRAALGRFLGIFFSAFVQL